MKIGVVSDTHSKQLPGKMLEDFGEVDLILHLGDYSDISIYNIFSQIKETKSVYGNMDEEELLKRFKKKEILEIENCRIGMFHGEGLPAKVLEGVQKVFKDDNVDAVLFGHSHRPLNERIDGVLYFNPGSPTDTFFAPYRSYGILDVSDGKIEARIVKVED
jgi:hypothetical protein